MCQTITPPHRAALQWTGFFFGRVQPYGSRRNHSFCHVVFHATSSIISVAVSAVDVIWNCNRKKDARIPMLMHYCVIVLLMLWFARCVVSRFSSLILPTFTDHGQKSLVEAVHRLMFSPPTKRRRNIKREKVSFLTSNQIITNDYSTTRMQSLGS